ncbi:NAD-binding protein [Polaromonas sp. P1(28)-13]|nr:NAD-binding protein [Polaromonas sp. P1(28)-13]
MQSPAELGQRCDVVLLCLPRSSDVHEVLLGTGGLAAALSAGKLVIDQTSGVASETRDIAQQLAQRGVDMIDAAVSASPQIVSQGGATLMASGPDDVFEKALPVLRVITETVYRCGQRVGDGQAMKGVNNAINAGVRIGTLEVVAMGRKAGLTLASMTEVLNRGDARNQTTEKMLPAIAQGRASTNFSLALMLKDVNQAVSLAMELGVPMPLTSLVRGLLQVGVNTVGADARLEDMIGVVESLAAVRLRATFDEAAAAEVDGASGRAEALKLVDQATAALCRLITYECVAVGVKFGLEVASMAAVLNKSSAWSGVSLRVLPLLGSSEKNHRSSDRNLAPPPAGGRTPWPEMRRAHDAFQRCTRLVRDWCQQVRRHGGHRRHGPPLRIDGRHRFQPGSDPGIDSRFPTIHCKLKSKRHP